MANVEGVSLASVGAALDLGVRAHVAFVGGGGKTTTMFAVARSLPSAVITTTTKMASNDIGEFAVVDSVEGLVDGARSILWTGRTGSKANGVTPHVCDALAKSYPYVLVEADGARHRPFTAPAAHEPVIPHSATHVVAMIGADAIGRCIGDQCHRPMRVAALAGCQPYERLTPARAASVLLSDRGSRKDVPSGAEFIVAISKVEETNIDLVAELVQLLGSVRSVVIEYCDLL